MQRTHKNFEGLDLVIENPAGTVRMGRGDRDWRSSMDFNYGFIAGTRAVDGDEIDVFFPPHKFESSMIYVIHQRKPGRRAWDEDKLMVGFADWEAAEKAYRKSYDNADLYMGPVTEWSAEELKTVLRNSGGEPGKLDAGAKKRWASKGQSKTSQMLLGLEVLPFLR